MTNEITSITRGPRQSNFELLRIIAMFMVLTVHADFLALGTPTAHSIAANPWGETVRTFFQALAVGGVNVFILISGWFGIRASLRGFCNFAFQVLFIFGVSYVAALALGKSELTLRNLASLLCLNRNGWFIVCYSALYILSPALNSLLDHSSKAAQRNLLIAFFLFQTIWGFLGNSATFGQGYSALSFMGLYLLAGFIRRHYAKSLGAVSLWAYLGLSALLTCAVIAVPSRADWLMYYDNPIVIAASVALTLAFARLDLGSSRIINFVAASAFAVYLFHTNPFVFTDFFVPAIKECRSGLAIVTVMLGVYVLALVIDQPRKWLWTLIKNHIPSPS